MNSISNDDTQPTTEGDYSMLNAAITFFALAIIAYLLGAGGVAGLSIAIGKTMLSVFLILALATFIASLVWDSRKVSHKVSHKVTHNENSI